jgi:hypothetical protein
MLYLGAFICSRSVTLLSAGFGVGDVTQSWVHSNTCLACADARVKHVCWRINGRWQEKTIL